MRSILGFLIISAAAWGQPREAICTVTDTGGDDAYAGSCPSGTRSVRLIASTANTGAATLDIGSGAVAIKHGGSSDPTDGAIPGTGKPIRLYHDGAYWQIEAAATASGGGAPPSVTGLYSATLDFGAIPDGACAQLTYSATGLATGQPLAVAPPSSLENGLTAMAFASAQDTVAIRLCNFSGAALNPASGAWAVRDMGTLGYPSGSSTLDFGAIPDGACASATFNMTGAAAGNNVAPRWPPTIESGLSGAMFVSAADTVAVRLCNLSGATVDPAAQTFGAAITK